MKRGHERSMDLAASASGNCPDDFVKRDSQTGSSCNSDGSQAQALSSSIDLGMSEPAKRLSAAERKLQSNRQAQKRFRQRQKERSNTAEAKLLETTAQLDELQARQRHLKARNMLLEKVARLNKQSILREAHEPVPLPWEGDAMWQTKLAEGGKTLVLTVWTDKTELLTVEQASQLTLSEFGNLWREYVQKLGACLLDAEEGLDEGFDGRVSSNMNKWAAEATSLMVCMALRNPWAVRAFNAAVDSSLKPGKTCAGQCKSSHLLEKIKTAKLSKLRVSFKIPIVALMSSFAQSSQAAVAYSPQQIKDLMRLRQLFYSKVGHLCRERKALLRHLTDEQDVGANIGLDDVSVRLSEVADFAEQLRANGADEYKTYMQFSSAFSRGLHTSRQLAIMIVHTHPWIPCKHHLLEELARQQNQPPVAEIIESAEADSLQHSADWEEIVSYLQTITPHNLHQHVPLQGSQQLQVGSSQDFTDLDVGLAEEILSVLQWKEL